MSDPERVGNMISGWSKDPRDMQRILDRLNAENGSGIETAATGGND